MSERRLLAIVELGGYPDFNPLYQRFGFTVETCHSMRRALAAVKRKTPEVIVCEFNFQSDFRDRTSSLESLIALTQRHHNLRTVVILHPDHIEQFKKLQAQHEFYATLPLPVTEAHMSPILKSMTEVAA